MRIGPASRDDLPAVRQLLDIHHLPLDGVDEHVDAMVVAKEEEKVVGAAALELYAAGALLRSVAVDPAMQGRGVGHALTDAALVIARERGAGAVFLLTTTAERFFQRFGFEVITRADVPDSVQASVEFFSACPASAVVMRKRVPSRG